MEDNDMDRSYIGNELRMLAQGKNLDGKLYYKDNMVKFVCETLELLLTEFNGNKSDDKKLDIEGLLKECLNYVNPCNNIESDVTPVNKIHKLGYGMSFTESVYEELDTMIKAGYRNKVIAEKLGIHPNSVTNRRRKLREQGMIN